MASREENEAVAGLLRRSLARDANAGSACLEPEILAAYSEHSLGADEAKTSDAHLSRCAHCREQLAAMARAEPSPELHVQEAQPRRAWLLDWRWLTAAAAVMVLVTVWLARGPHRLAPTSQPQNPPLVAANKVESAKPNLPTADYDANTLSSKSESGSPREVPTNRIATPVKSTSVASKKVAPSAQKADDLEVVASNQPKKEQQPQLADSIAANESSNSELGARDLKQSIPAAQQARSISSGHNFAAQQNQTTQSVTVEGQAQPRSRVSAQPSGAQVGTGQASFQMGPGSGGGVGSGAATAETKAQAKPGPRPSAAPAAAREGGAISGVAGANASLDAKMETKNGQGVPSDTNPRLAKDRGAALQVLEERSSEKVINTPVPTVKWRINAAGFVERSEDGGATWKGQELDTTGALLAASAPDGKTCWVVGRGGLVFVTKDAANWKKIPSPVSADIVAVSAQDASSATVTTADGRRFSTHNRGKKWKLESESQHSQHR